MSASCPRDKGLPTLLRAYESLGRKRPPLLLVGRRTPDTPTHLPDGAEMCAEWPHDHVMAAFRRCLFAVLPSICLDACPTTVLEAMASGRPVVATTTGGIVDMIADGENGLLVPPGDEDKLAEAMARLLNDADLRVRLAAGAQERVQRFTASAVVGAPRSRLRAGRPARFWDVAKNLPVERRRTRCRQIMIRDGTSGKDARQSTETRR